MLKKMILSYVDYTIENTKKKSNIIKIIKKMIYILII